MTDYELGKWEYDNGHDPDPRVSDADYWRGWLDAYNADV